MTWTWGDRNNCCTGRWGWAAIVRFGWTSAYRSQPAKAYSQTGLPFCKAIKTKLISHRRLSNSFRSHRPPNITYTPMSSHVMGTPKPFERVPCSFICLKQHEPRIFLIEFETVKFGRYDYNWSKEIHSPLFFLSFFSSFPPFCSMHPFS